MNAFRHPVGKEERRKESQRKEKMKENKVKREKRRIWKIMKKICKESFHSWISVKYIEKLVLNVFGI